MTGRAGLPSFWNMEQCDYGLAVATYNRDKGSRVYLPEDNQDARLFEIMNVFVPVG